MIVTDGYWWARFIEDGEPRRAEIVYVEHEFPGKPPVHRFRDADAYQIREFVFINEVSRPE